MSRGYVKTHFGDNCFFKDSSFKRYNRHFEKEINIFNINVGSGHCNCGCGCGCGGFFGGIGGFWGTPGVSFLHGFIGGLFNGVLGLFGGLGAGMFCNNFNMFSGMPNFFGGGMFNFVNSSPFNFIMPMSGPETDKKVDKKVDKKETPADTKAVTPTPQNTDEISTDPTTDVTDSSNAQNVNNVTEGDNGLLLRGVPAYNPGAPDNEGKIRGTISPVTDNGDGTCTYTIDNSTVEGDYGLIYTFTGNKKDGFKLQSIKNPQNKSFYVINDWKNRVYNYDAQNGQIEIPATNPVVSKWNRSGYDELAPNGELK